MGRYKLARPNYVLRRNRQGYWEVRWTDPTTGRTRFKTTATKLRHEAQERLGSIVGTLHLPQPLTILRIAPVLDAYIAAKPRERFVLQAIRERLGYLEPAKLNDAVARSYAEWRATSGVSDGTIIRELAILRAALNWGTRNNLGYNASDVGTFTMPVAKPQPRQKWLDRTQCYKLIYIGCNSEDQAHVRLFIRIALATGARQQAILQLTWDRVRFPDPDLATEMDKEYPLHERLVLPVVLDFGKDVGKKRRSRDVPIGDNAVLYRELLAAKQRARTNHVIEWNGKPLANIKTALNAAYRRAGLKVSGSHILRHSAVSLMVANGIPYEKIGRLVGMSPRMVEQVYGHVSVEYLNMTGSVTAF